MSRASFTEQVHRMVALIPPGRVASYGGVAAVMGQPRAARGVVNRNGEISIRGFTHGPQLQRSLLEGEGVTFDRHGRIDWSRFGWSGDAGDAGDA
jgi:methylated-DNA-protein-cysteine methyltransferase related protein